MDPKRVKILKVAKLLMIALIVFWTASLVVTGLVELFDPADFISPTFLVFLGGIPLVVVELISLALYRSARHANQLLESLGSHPESTGKSMSRSFAVSSTSLLIFLSIIYFLIITPFVISLLAFLGVFKH